jgi:5-methylcytosine-specific restriction endonuclease McrA
MLNWRFKSSLPSRGRFRPEREQCSPVSGSRWYSEEQVRAAVADPLSYAEVLRRLGLRAAGGNHRTIRRYVEEVWRIPVDHFDAQRARRSGAPVRAVPLADVLVQRSTYHRGHLKRRLLEEGLKRRECEICGQGGIWRGHRMSLVLDHINGVHDDHRLENLRILCPNCNATLDTHCGRRVTRRASITTARARRVAGYSVPRPVASDTARHPAPGVASEIVAPRSLDARWPGRRTSSSSARSKSSAISRSAASTA